MTTLEWPIIVCLCGSTRFSEAYRAANLSETLAGRIVLSVGCDFKSDDALGLTQADKARLDELHKRKIDLADEILVLNVGGYVGTSTASEIAYAEQHDKRVRWLECPGINAVSHWMRFCPEGDGGDCSACRNGQDDEQATLTVPETMTEQVQHLVRLSEEMMRRLKRLPTDPTPLACLHLMRCMMDAMINIATALRHTILQEARCIAQQQNVTTEG